MTLNVESRDAYRDLIGNPEKKDIFKVDITLCDHILIT